MKKITPDDTLRRVLQVLEHHGITPTEELTKSLKAAVEGDSEYEWMQKFPPALREAMQNVPQEYKDRLERTFREIQEESARPQTGGFIPGCGHHHPRYRAG